MRLFKTVLFLLLFMYASSGAFAGEVTVTDSTRKINLGKHLQIFEDKSRSATIDDILSGRYDDEFTDSTVDTPYLEFTDSAVWARFSLNNEGTSHDSWLLEFAFPLMDTIELYRMEGGTAYEKISTGYMTPFYSRDIQHNNFLFEISPPTNMVSTYYMRLTNRDRMEIPLKLWNRNTFFQADHDNQFVMGIYTGFILLLIMINIIMYFAMRDRTFIYHTFFMTAYMVFYMTQFGYTFQYLTPHEFYAVNHHIPLNIALLLVALLLFNAEYLDLKSKSKTEYMASFFLCGVVGTATLIQFFLPYWFAVYTQMVLSVVTIFMVIVMIIRSIVRNYKPAIFYATGLTLMAVGGLLYAFKVAGLLPSVFVVNYGLQLGSLVHFMLVTAGLGLRINIIYQARMEAERKAHMTQERYRALVEGTDDLIFTLDENFTFVTINKAVKKHLLIKPESLIGTSFLDIVYDYIEEGASTTSNFIREILEKFSRERTPIQFQASCKTAGVLEPKSLTFKLEFIQYAGRTEIFGKAQAVIEDSLIQYFSAERQIYRIENYLLTANDLTQRLTRNLTRYMKEKKAAMIRVALREIIINAIEHGNLALTYEEKTAAKMRNDYFEFLAHRRMDPKYASKKVKVEYLITKKKVEYTVTDEGDGFEYEKYLENDSNDVNLNLDSHGRGISMTKNIFDEISYNKKGNRVTLVKYF